MSRKYARRGTGSARKRNGRWELRTQLYGETCVFRGDTLAEAQALAAVAATQPQRHATATSATLRDWLAEWLTRKQASVRPQTYFAYEAHARRHIVPAIGDIRLDALAPEHIDKLHAQLARTVSGTTAHHVHMTLSTALTDAKRRGLRLTNAVWAVTAPRRASREIQTLTREEVSRLLESVRGDPLEAMYVLAVTLGLREGELLGLTWQHVDLDQRRLVIRGNATRSLDGTRAVTEPKTAAGRRVLRLPSIAAGALERTPHLGELVWPGPNGQPLPASTFYKRWMAVRRRAGIRPVSFHALRHTAATLAIEGGQPLQAVTRMLGHSVVTTTMKLYVHATDASAEALADFIDFQYGPELRVVPGAELDANWTPKSMNIDIATETECRERESNPYALTSTAP
jgi:integrase